MVSYLEDRMNTFNPTRKILVEHLIWKGQKVDPISTTPGIQMK